MLLQQKDLCYFVKHIENLALMMQLQFQSKLGKCQVFPLIVVADTAAYQFRKDVGYVQQLLFQSHDLSKALLIFENMSNKWPVACRRCLFRVSRAGLKPMQMMQLHWSPRHGFWVDCSFCQIHLALENSVKTPYKFHC